MKTNLSLFIRTLPLTADRVLGLLLCLGICGIASQAAPVDRNTPNVSVPGSSKNDRLILWDGDTESREAGGWSGPNSAINTLEMTTAQAHGGQNSLHWRGAGSGLVSAAWNFFNYQQAEKSSTGFDISGYSTLRLWLKVDAEAGREPSGLSLSLSSASNRRSSVEMNLDSAVKQSSDGEWHEVVIPLQSLLPKADYKTPDARRFDPKTVWEIGFSSWSSDERAFDVYIDDISVDIGIKTPAIKSSLKPKKPVAKKSASKKRVLKKRRKKTKKSRR